MSEDQQAIKTTCGNCGTGLYQVSDPNNLHWYHAGTGDVRCPTRFAVPVSASVQLPSPQSEVIARGLVQRWDRNNGMCLLHDHEADLIHRVASALTSAQQRGAELQREVDAKVAEQMRPTGGRMWTDEQTACFNALTDCAANIRANRQQ